jgi:general secretion pathway protein G
MKERRNPGTVILILVTTVTIIAVVALRKYSEFQREHYLKPAQTRNDILKIMTALITYQKQQGAYPDTNSYHIFLNYKSDQTYKTKIPIKDPWGKDYSYYSPGPNNLPYSIISYGADETEGGAGKDEDISSDPILKEHLKNLKQK